MSQPFLPKQWRCWIRLSIWRALISRRGGAGATNSSKAARRFRWLGSRRGSRVGTRRKNCLVHLLTRLDDHPLARRAGGYRAIADLFGSGQSGAARRAMEAIVIAIDRLQEFSRFGHDDGRHRYSPDRRPVRRFRLYRPLRSIG